MKKLFISQPMNGKTEKEILAERDRAMIQAAKRIGEPVFVLDSVLKDSPEGVNRPLWCLGRSLQIMAEADVAYFAKGWDKARGCRIEHLCADEYGVLVIEEAVLPAVEFIDMPQGFELTTEILTAGVGHKDPPGEPGEPGVREVADDG